MEKVSINIPEAEEKMKTNNSGKGKTPMDMALGYLTARARTVAEMEAYLDKRQFGEFEVYQVVERLKELHYLDDKSYAEEFVRTRLATKPISRRKLREQLIAHKIPRDYIDEVIAEITDKTEAENAAKVAEKFWRQFESLPDQDRRTRVLRRLFSHGYDYDTARESVASVIGSFEREEYMAFTDVEEDEAE